MLRPGWESKADVAGLPGGPTADTTTTTGHAQAYLAEQLEGIIPYHGKASIVDLPNISPLLFKSFHKIVTMWL
jgi:hypothetical protein